LATVAVASCAPSHSLQQVKTSNPSVTYEYRGDQELLQAQQNAVTFCNQYGSAPRPARFTTGSNGQSNSGQNLSLQLAGYRAQHKEA
jgi:hypothetical protein